MVTERTVYRNRNARAFSYYVIGTGVLVVFGAVADSRSPATVLVGLFALVSIGWGATMLRRVGVEATDDGLVLHRLLTKPCVPWTRASGFALRGVSVYLTTTDGRSMKTVGLGPSFVRVRGLGGHDASQALVDHLNGLIHQHNAIPE